eukprot:4227419-Amphidinium_carterae.1
MLHFACHCDRGRRATVDRENKKHVDNVLRCKPNAIDSEQLENCNIVVQLIPNTACNDFCHDCVRYGFLAFGLERHSTSCENWAV